ncbi:CHASE3 domain-containing protein [Bacillus sp. S3]|uniref:CHASE3 domain-containing protein n=1 Tax=Bacillus sp. S3 TaxID=486398 RepID=UPI0016817793|nr:CHASE3 domain-containing protein [Bacillus sp. S3]
MVCLVLALLIVLNRMTALQDEVDFVSKHDIEVHDLANQIQRNILDMETGMRGYALTGDESYLEPYNLASRTWLDNYNKLHSMLDANSAQQRNLEEMKPLIISWLANSGEYVINHKKADNTAALNEHFDKNTGKKVTDQLRTLLESFLATEKKVTADRIGQLDASNNNLKITLYALIVLVTIITLATAIILSNSIVKTIKEVIGAIKNITDSDSESEVDLTARIHVHTRDETRELAEAMNDLLGTLEKHNWVQKSRIEISMMFQGITDINVLAQSFVTRLAQLFGASYGVVYLRRTKEGVTDFVKVAGYAIADEDSVKKSFGLGEGLIGQAALNQRLLQLDQVPEEHYKVTSGFGASSPTNLLIAPFSFEGQVEAVVELASFQPNLPEHVILINQLQDKFGLAITSVKGRMEVERLLGESQMLTEELQAQSEELQAQSEELQMQQEQLRISNEILEEQKKYAEQRAFDLKQAKDELEDYSEKLKLSSQYKTDFLANMSHELRTPLNSILILSQMMTENIEEMDKTEVADYARVVNSSGGDLLRLIDDILDLSKVEAGKIEILIDEVNVTEIPQMMHSLFDPVAKNKNLTFDVRLDQGLPAVIFTDGQRLQQIWKNLLSNAFKFTETGGVTVRVIQAPAEKIAGPGTEEVVLAIEVTDTGIGIPHDKQQIIFDAFQQVDGKTNRQFGGTGLGLSICREFTQLLGGAIEVQSKPNKGSTFTVYIPSRQKSDDYGRVTDYLAFDEVAASVEDMLEETETEGTLVEFGESEMEVSGDHIFKGKKVLLVEDDGRNVFAIETALVSKGIVVEVAANGKQALRMLQEADYDLVFMDIMMPVMGGYEAMRAIRDNLGMHDLPIIALTAKAMKGERDKCMEAGASDYIMKPLNIDQLFSLMRVWLTEQVKAQ